MVHRCECRLVVLQVDAQNLLWVIIRGIMTLPLNLMATDLFWFCLKHRITVSVEWVPRELNAWADEISKFLIPDDWSLSLAMFRQLEIRWGPRTCDLFSSGANNMCAKFFSLHWCRGTTSVNAFGQVWSGDNC